MNVLIMHYRHDLHIKCLALKELKLKEFKKLVINFKNIFYLFLHMNSS